MARTWSDAAGDTHTMEMKKMKTTMAFAAALACAFARADELDDLLMDDPEPAAAEEPAETTQPQAVPAKEQPAETAPARPPETADGDATAEDGMFANDGDAGESGAGDRKVAFDTLPYCRSFTGVAEVLVPGAAGKWKAVEESRRYPLGSVFRTVGKDSRLEIRFSIDCRVNVRGDSSFGTRAQPFGEKHREIVLTGGSIWVKLPSKLPPGMFSVNAPGFTAKDLTGEARFFYQKTGDGDTATLRCVSESFTVEGRHFKLLAVRAGQEVRIRTSQDLLFTGLYGSRGDVIARLDTGLHVVRDIETGEMKNEEKPLDWKLSPRTAVRIHRSVPAIGERMAVCVMTFDENGTMRENRAFAENTPGVAYSGPASTSRKEREALQKRAEDAAKDATGEQAN